MLHEAGFQTVMGMHYTSLPCNQKERTIPCGIRVLINMIHWVKQGDLQPTSSTGDGQAEQDSQSSADSGSSGCGDKMVQKVVDARPRFMRA